MANRVERLVKTAATDAPGHCRGGLNAAATDATCTDTTTDTATAAVARVTSVKHGVGGRALHLHFVEKSKPTRSRYACCSRLGLCRFCCQLWLWQRMGGGRRMRLLTKLGVLLLRL